MGQRFPAWKSFHFAALFAYVLLVVAGLVFRQPPAHLVFGISGLLFLVIRDFSAGELGGEGEFPSWAGWAALAAFLLFALGSWMGSDTAQKWGVSLLGGVWIRSIYGGIGAYRLLLLIGLLCIPQGVLEDTLLLRMQRSAAGLASWVLDTQRIAHVPKGAVIETASGVLFVEEACSGMMSLLTGLIVAQIYFAWQRMRLWMSAVGLALAAALLFAGNCLRIIVIAVAYAHWHIDWTSGWRHELSGLLVYLLVLSLLPGLRHLLVTVSELVFLWRYPWITHDSQVEIQPSPGSFDFKLLVCSLMRCFPPAAAWSSACMLLAALMTFGSSEVSGNKANAADWPSLRAAELTRSINGWTLDSTGREVSFLKNWGLNHQVWLYRKGFRKAWISADLPFDSVHTLPNCYSMRDWRILRNERVLPPDSEPLNVMELKSQGESGSLLILFSNYDLTLRKIALVLPTRLRGRWEQVISRLKIGREDLGLHEGPFCQIQLVLEGGDVMESEVGKDALELFKKVRCELIEKLHESSDSDGREGH